LAVNDPVNAVAMSSISVLKSVALATSPLAGGVTARVYVPFESLGIVVLRSLL
jgi:hypothetical protein